MDWKQLICELREAGLKQADIAASVGVTQSSISDLATGLVEPKFKVGDKLVKLHERICSITANNSKN